MENTIRIESLRWYPSATAQQLLDHQKTLLAEDKGTLIVLPDPEDLDMYLGVLLAKYYTRALSGCVGVRGTRQEGDFCYLVISGIAVRGFVGSVMRRMRPYCPVTLAETTTLEDFLEQEPPAPVKKEEPPVAKGYSDAMKFLQAWSPAKIQQALDEYVIGQSELTRAVADFLYYHVLRQVHPHLPQRPLLISGPSGSGKTEVWRVVRQLFGYLLPVRIIDGSNLSCEGWSGNYKLDTYIDATMVEGGILVVDEFDKLTKPKRSSSGENVSLDMQSEFLKLIEGEYRITEKRKQTNMTSQKMGFVLVGAFESLRAKKQGKKTSPQNPIGFCAQREDLPVSNVLTDEDFIAYGIMPELVGRIAIRCASNPLPDSAYLDIIQGPHSRVSQLAKVLRAYGVTVEDVITPPILQELVASSKSNQTGVRWVSAQVENRLLEAIYEQGLFSPCAAVS